MKILLVHNYYRGKSPGGEDVVVNSECDLLRSAGYEVQTYTRSNDEMDENSWLDRLRVVASLNGFNSSHRDLMSLVQAQRPDIVHVHNTFPLVGEALFDLCRQLSIPTVQTIHSFRPSCLAATHYRDGAICEQCSPGRYAPGVRFACYRGSWLASQVVARAQASSARRHRDGRGADRYVLLSDFAAARLAGTAFPVDRVRVRPNFVTIPPGTEPASGVSVSRAGRYAVFAGRIAREKGVRTLIGAWEGLRDMPLRIIGDGPAMAEIRAEATRRQLPIEFMGFQSRASSLTIVREAALQVVPSEWFEGMPLVILEAWALGVPLVVSRVGGCAELIGCDERGLGFRAGDEADLVGQVRRLWADESKARQLAVAGQARYLERHTPDRGLASLLAIYQEIISRHAA
ncbi:MAG: glycosyltransferase family 4 protein [Gammaproteobacteria bacterium]|nr:glycosyltransferase family 4 protein [Gammaproteobacteria bacterium]